MSGPWSDFVRIVSGRWAGRERTLTGPWQYFVRIVRGPWADRDRTHKHLWFSSFPCLCACVSACPVNKLLKTDQFPRNIFGTYAHGVYPRKRGVEVTKLLTVQSSPSSCHPVPLSPKYLPQHPILKQPQLMFFPCPADQVCSFDFRFPPRCL